ncbi:hypothetical protein H311_01512 [Anncaliia algerae PRA109]|nr:hypothetical protein H311_01512 [Anncaliia algerae PRA109]
MSKKKLISIVISMFLMGILAFIIYNSLREENVNSNLSIMNNNSSFLDNLRNNLQEDHEFERQKIKKERKKDGKKNTSKQSSKKEGDDKSHKKSKNKVESAKEKQRNGKTSATINQNKEKTTFSKQEDVLKTDKIKMEDKPLDHGKEGDMDEKNDDGKNVGKNKISEINKVNSEKEDKDFNLSIDGTDLSAISSITTSTVVFERIGSFAWSILMAAASTALSIVSFSGGVASGMAKAISQGIFWGLFGLFSASGGSIGSLEGFNITKIDNNLFKVEGIFKNETDINEEIFFIDVANETIINDKNETIIYENVLENDQERIKKIFEEIRKINMISDIDLIEVAGVNPPNFNNLRRPRVYQNKTAIKKNKKIKKQKFFTTPDQSQQNFLDGVIDTSNEEGNHKTHNLTTEYTKSNSSKFKDGEEFTTEHGNNIFAMREKYQEKDIIDLENPNFNEIKDSEEVLRTKPYLTKNLKKNKRFQSNLKKDSNKNGLFKPTIDEMKGFKENVNTIEENDSKETNMIFEGNKTDIKPTEVLENNKISPNLIDILIRNTTDNANLVRNEERNKISEKDLKSKVVKDIANAQENIKSSNLNVSSLGNGNSKVEKNIPLQEFKLVQENNTYNVQESTKPKIYKDYQIPFGNGNKISKEYAAGKDNHESLDIPYQPSDKTN